MTEIGFLSPENMRLLWQDYLERKQLAPRQQRNFPQRRIIDEPSPHRVFVRNDSGEEIPAYGCMEVTGTDTVGSRPVVTVEKPTLANDEFLFNSQFPIASGANGWAYRLGVVVMLGSGADNTRYIAQSGSWEITAGDGPFFVFGEYETGTLIGRIGASAGGADEIEPNPGVARAKIDGVSPCLTETLAEAGFHIFLATITSRPFPNIDEMRRERDTEITIFDPSGCMLDAAYDPADFIDAVVWVSLMYGGLPYDRFFDFKSAADMTDDYVIPGDDYPTTRPATLCQKFGWLGGDRTGYSASIGPVIPDGACTFQVELPERGTYEVDIVYGDATDPTNNDITLFDGDIELDTFTDSSEIGMTWQSIKQYEFKSTNRPLLKVELSNAAGKDSRITSLDVRQVTPPTRWEVINRCCIPKDFE